MKKKNPKVRLNPDGVPIEARDWTVEDWRDLWIAVQAVEIRIAARYREAQEGSRDAARRADHGDEREGGDESQG